MDIPTNTSSHHLTPRITREIIINIDRTAELNAADIFADSMNSLYSLKEIFESSVNQFRQNETSLLLPESDQSLLRAFYTLRLAGYLRIFFDEEDPGDWLDDKETETELWLKHNETDETTLLERG